ncbi:hypothetical protein Mterra_03099 [Calidithermus terrae]|uniref:Uncharacterized protein n=1 Tax=Calidithermus terrae TaxID=1408545 RepID=A0A399EEW4_9DEIN|nr:hypothetical protein [Calidithermus terrae]RIH81540.1 hypothetical protein Mterra_03099 [Calidithermus terrae]
MLEDWNKANEANPNYRLVDTGREEFRAVFNILSGIAKKEPDQWRAVQKMREIVLSSQVQNIFKALERLHEQYERWFLEPKNLTDIWVAWHQDSAEVYE